MYAKYRNENLIKVSKPVSVPDTMKTQQQRKPSRHSHGRSEVKERPEILAALALARTRLGVRLKELRKSRGLSQERAAERIGVHPVQLARMEHGVSNVTLATLVATALAYDVPLRNLFEDETMPGL